MESAGDAWSSHHYHMQMSVHYMTERACYMTIHAHCSIMQHKTIYKIYIPLLLKIHFKPPLGVGNNFRLPCFDHVMLLILNVIFRAAIIEERTQVDRAGSC